MCTDELRQELNQVNSVTVTIDPSNIKIVKFVLIVVCHFLPEIDFEVKLEEGCTPAIKRHQNALSKKLAEHFE